MTLRTFSKLIAITGVIFSAYFASANASQCIVIGDSQSALSLEQVIKRNEKKGLIPRLESGLESMGHTAHFYALKGSGAADWIGSPKANKNTLIGLEKNRDSIVPFHTASTKKVTLDTTKNKTFVDQIFEAHGTSDVDCFLIQLGDNDIFREKAAFYMSELVKHVLGQDKSPRLCAVIAPTFKEETSRDEFPFITNQKKLAYITQVRHYLQKNNLLEDCPVVSTMSPTMETNLKDSGSRVTLDGLFYNSKGGEIWAEQIFQSRPFLSRR